MKEFTWDVCTDQSGLFNRAGFRGKEDRIIKTASRNYERDSYIRTLFFIPATPEVRLFVKRFKIYNFRERLKSFFLHSKAIRECAALRYLRSKNIPVPRAVAVLERKSWGILQESYLFTIELTQTITLKEFLQKNYGACRGKITDQVREEKTIVLKKVATLIRGLHSANFYHRDLHGGNILVKVSGDETLEEPSLYVIDLHRGGRIKWLTGRKKLFNLAQLCHSLSLVLPITDIVRFLIYYRGLDLRRETIKPFVRDTLDLINRIRHGYWRSRTKRALKKSSAFSVDNLAGYRFYHPRSIPAETVINLVQKHNNWREKEPVRLLKTTPKRFISIHPVRSADSRVNKPTDSSKALASDASNGVQVLPEKDGGRCYVKEYRYRGLTHLANLGRRHPARAAWFALQGFRVRGFNTPEPVALVEKKIWGLLISARRAWLILKEIEDALPSSEYALVTFSNMADSQKRWALKNMYLRSFAREIAHLHQRGIFHTDLKANNIMVKPVGELDLGALLKPSPWMGEGRVGVKESPSPNPSHQGRGIWCNEPDWTFYFLDLEGVKFRRPGGLKWSERIKNLAQLNAATTGTMTRADRLRFLKNYLAHIPPLEPQQREKIIAEIMHLTIKRQHFWPPR